MRSTAQYRWRSLFTVAAVVLISCGILWYRPKCITNECQIRDTIAQRVFSTKKNPPPLLLPLASKTLREAGKASPDEELERIWNYVYDRQYHCTESEYLGGNAHNGDGAYDLCIEEQFWPLRKSNDSKCLMYSFGVGGDFTFDDEVARRGCEVHSFDPSENLKDGLVRESGVTFHKVGISNEDNDSGFKGWKMRTLKTLMNELGHSDRYLDYLKIDTDKGDGSGFEDVLIQEILDTGLYKCVRQYAMEIHMPSPLSNSKWLERSRLLYRQMIQLNEGGWRLYNTTDNVRAIQAIVNKYYTQRRIKVEMLIGRGGTILWEVAFVNFHVQGNCKNYL